MFEIHPELLSINQGTGFTAITWDLIWTYGFNGTHSSALFPGITQFNEVTIWWTMVFIIDLGTGVSYELHIQTTCKDSIIFIWHITAAATNIYASIYLNLSVKNVKTSNLFILIHGFITRRDREGTCSYQCQQFYSSQLSRQSPVILIRISTKTEVNFGENEKKRT